ncbi:heat shock protein transcriptional repressor HspR [Phytoactinopolyspora halotolerans]|uniref:Helix-turn-helix transcriptional regulator n=1 Tax=Phytoactinopolyspora halotolerans TaxID=1981512 RepID=A0A6L9S3J7_9ACTN|nr:helix-turn-helix transcriptional regulator [Phytoactinopolyspora halotolerans]NED99161.1 helix-turn-helix transcriptional regulator [Phytoactinopolyspora halotolerans]
MDERTRFVVAMSGAARRVRDDEPLYVISVAAEMAGMHPQTLRQYDRLGLVSPRRTDGGGRRYSLRDVERLREVQRLSQEEGVNLVGVKRIMELEAEVEALRAQLELVVEAQQQSEYLAQSHRRSDYLPVPSFGGSALAIYRTRRSR